MKPMLMNTEMVRAILAGRKTVTRRLIKLVPADDYHFIELETDPDEIRIQPGSGEEYPYKLSGLYAIFTGGFGGPMVKSLCQPGDVLYVREAWCKVRNLFSGIERYLYRVGNDDLPCRWRPSIHMPKEAARIFLRVTDVRVERLQDMTIDDYIKEGANGIVCPDCSGNGCSFCAHSGWLVEPKSEFIDIWNCTIKKAALAKYGWGSNPWTWVIEFERISREEALKNA